MALDDIAAEKAARQEQGGDAPRRGPGRPKKVTALPPPPPEPPAIPPEVLDQMMGQTVAQLGQLPCIKFGWKPLDEQEMGMLVAGTKPLLAKYLPDMLGAWGPEIMFLAVVTMIYGKRYAEAAERAKSDPTGIRDRGNGNGQKSPFQGINEGGAPINRSGPPE